MTAYPVDVRVQHRLIVMRGYRVHESLAHRSAHSLPKFVLRFHLKVVSYRIFDLAVQLVRLNRADQPLGLCLSLRGILGGAEQIYPDI